MKLITNNLTGYNAKGERYKITIKDEYSKKHNCRYITVTRYLLDVEENDWVYNDMVLRSYQPEETEFKTMLQKTLLEAENRFNIQLIKSQMQIAV